MTSLGPRSLVVATATGVEAAAVRPGLSGATLVRAGVRARRGDRVRSALTMNHAAALGITGVAGALVDGIGPGEVVVADEVRSSAGTYRLAAAPLLVAALREAGLTVHLGPIRQSGHLVGRGEHAALAKDGSIAVDMESGTLLQLVDGVPAAVVRIVSDTPDRPLWSPSTVTGGLTALRSLRTVGPVLRRWVAATGDRRLVMASPRSFCAGVERAIRIVDSLLQTRQSPVYVRKQIVHNSRVVHGLEGRGAVFVDELAEVPDGATVVFSAHGVAPAVRSEAAQRGLDVVDATCPLVAKVHTEAKRFVRDGHTVLLIGHAGHEEVEGTLGEEPAHTVLVQSVQDAELVQVRDPDQVAYLMQTTLAADEAADLVGILRSRFPRLRGPESDDICYATTNRQHAVREVARQSDLVLVAGSENSSNSRRLVEVAQREGAEAHLVDAAAQISLDWLVGARTIGISAGASAPAEVVDEIVAALGALGRVRIDTHETTTEKINFTLPKEVRQQ